MTDAPGKTGTPLIEDVDEDSVTLSWTKPKDDGGDKVQGYVVEVREKGTNKWKPLNEKSPCRDNKFTGRLCHDDGAVASLLKPHLRLMQQLYLADVKRYFSVK